ncbi:flagellar hook-associated protein FlgK [Brevibacillus formosus]|uniref:Flagellar hook-associated protein 1 n=1 Tax=Brevibacillus formosus TaxID=54913 RepID=A0A837KP85_9BACL|nr:flagellar hook-associated protein FlgK [Brevibacillus formosus]KLH98973.1 flagellar hook protein [Brevibacillus formosus]MED1956359.1 flagellar hook-associated protein FlgK [Brevibacillus formosus]PSJ97998.1 flagellar hook-associated protein FlgK [Brevibacillus formosus]GED56746.1 flagellar hook-associated protein 1 [Brevibacillus formosus]
MRSTFHGIEVSKRGLFAQQSALNTTGHNISNANTEGYSRQRVNMQATTGLPYVGMQASIEPGLLGTGVQATSIQRLREEFLDIQYRNEHKRQGYWDGRLETLEKLEGIMNEPSDTGLQKVMDQMWQAWQDLAKDPTDTSARAVVRERSKAVADTFNTLTNHIKEVQTDLNNVVNVKAMEINSLGQQIANLNNQIANVVPHGYQPNDLYDQRDVLLDKLSKLVEVRTTQSTAGMVNVTIEGREFVTGITSQPVATVQNPATGLSDMTLGGAAFVPTTGYMAGTFQSRDQIVPNMLKRLDVLAVNLTKEINDLHRAGRSLSDINNGTVQDLPFFVDANSLAANPATKDYPKGASSLAINPEIMKSLDAIAAAQEEAGSTPVGNNKSALAIASIKFKVLTAGTGPNDLAESSTLDNYYRYTISQLGVDAQEAKRNQLNSEMLVGTVDNQRQSVSGVSIDDEMAEMVKYQHAYSASARVMTSMDEVLDKVINGMGRVGL